MGIQSWRLASIVVTQGLLAGVAGALPGALLGGGVVTLVRQQGLAAVLTPSLALLTVLLTLATCAIASLASVRRVARLEPALVFRT
jgi:ABC-type antimicrobial peptide transport system permease subunit